MPQPDAKHLSQHNSHQRNNQSLNPTPKHNMLMVRTADAPQDLAGSAITMQEKYT